MTGAVIAAAAAFLAMEPATSLAHRLVMHGPGWRLHRSHHRPTRPGVQGWQRLEANDVFPVMFAALTISAMTAGTAWRSWSVLVAVGVGVTAYGATYALVHDVYIHGRLGRAPTWGPLERLRAAHAIHHRFGGSPYGMLWPVLPAGFGRQAAEHGSQHPRKTRVL